MVAKRISHVRLRQVPLVDPAQSFWLAQRLRRLAKLHRDAAEHTEVCVKAVTLLGENHPGK